MDSDIIHGVSGLFYELEGGRYSFYHASITDVERHTCASRPVGML
jgi:hypothetical protein